MTKADSTQEVIPIIKPVIQHNIERKRPVFTLPSDKNNTESQRNPFDLINKYYNENFILEDDEEEIFKSYIYNNDNSLDEQKDYSSKNSKDNFGIDNNSNIMLENNLDENNEEEDKKLVEEEKIDESNYMKTIIKEIKNNIIIDKFEEKKDVNI